MHHRGRQVDVIVNLEGLRPIHFAGGRVERNYRQRMPQDELPHAGGLEDDGLRVTRLLVLGGKSAPDLFSGALIERHHFGVAGAAD